MKTLIAFGCGLVLAGLRVGPLFADSTTLFESATLGSVGQLSGSSLDAQYMGVRFHFNNPVQIESIGGHVGGIPGVPGTIFGAIVSLASPTAFPSGRPFDSTTMASVTFTPPSPSADILVPLSATLMPGDYALIFGGQQFGATGAGLMPSNNHDLVGPQACFRWDSGDQAWRANVEGGERFVITGTVIPEPTTIALMTLALAAIYVSRRSRRV